MSDVVPLTQDQVYRRNYYLKNKARELELSKAWRNKNIEKVRQWRIKLKDSDVYKERLHFLQKRWRAEKKISDPTYEHKLYIKHKVKINITRKVRAKELKTEIMKAYGGVCTCCGEKKVEFLCMDHINNDGKEHRKTLGSNKLGTAFYRYLKNEGFPKGQLQVLCLNCNGAKAYYGICPHQQERAQA